MPGKKSRPKSVRDEIYKLIASRDLYSDADGIAYMTIPAGDEGTDWFEVHAIRSSAGRSCLVRMFIDEFGCSPSSQGLNEGIVALESQARRCEILVGLRTMQHKKGFALDLGDKKWTRIVVTPGSWSASNDKHPPFRRGSGAQPLPSPITSGKFDRLRSLLNIESDKDWSLILGWLVWALQPNGPFPILVLQGEHGSCKSTAARMLTSLIDPNDAPLVSLPKCERDLMVIARSRHVLAFDNISTLSPEMKDALCRLATGSGHAARKLYSDNETVVWKASKPQIVNGIDGLLVADDLADRAIGITLPHIPASLRRRESELWSEFRRIHFEILGALLDAAAWALEAPAPRSDLQLPRMADFAHFAASAACAWGVEYDEFITSYDRNRSDAVERGLDTDPLAQAICALLDSKHHWQGTKGELLNELKSCEIHPHVLECLPQTPRMLGANLRRLSPALRSVGIEVTDRRRTNCGYQILLERTSSDSGALSEHCERPTLLNLEEEKKKRRRHEGPQGSQRSPRSPIDDSTANGGQP